MAQPALNSGGDDLPHRVALAGALDKRAAWVSLRKAGHSSAPSGSGFRQWVRAYYLLTGANFKPARLSLGIDTLAKSVIYTGTG